MTDVRPEEIQQAGRRIATEGDEWLDQIREVRDVNTGAFGDDLIGRSLAVFHRQVHEVSITYFTEVGECAGDVGVGLARVGELYAETELDNVSRALAVANQIRLIGPF